MLECNFAHDGQAQSRAVDLRAQRTIKRPEDQIALGQRDTRARVFDLQHRGRFVCRHVDAYRHTAAARCVLQGVVHQVAHHFAHQHGLPHQLGMFGAFKAQIDALFHGPGNKIAHGFQGDLRQVDGLNTQHLFLAFSTCHGQQLVHHVRSALARQRNLLQGMFHGLRVGESAVEVAPGKLGLHAQACQRCF